MTADLNFKKENSEISVSTLHIWAIFLADIKEKGL